MPCCAVCSGSMNHLFRCPYCGRFYCSEHIHPSAHRCSYRDQPAGTPAVLIPGWTTVPEKPPVQAAPQRPEKPPLSPVILILFAIVFLAAAGAIWALGTGMIPEKPYDAPVPVTPYTPIPTLQYMPPAPVVTARTIGPDGIPFTGSVIGGGFPEGGEGVFIIDNSAGTTDAVVTLDHYRSDSPARERAASIYVGHGEIFTWNGITDGNYWITIMTGRDWDGKTLRFTRNLSYRQVNSPAAFKTTSEMMTEYTVYTLVINASAGGMSSPITPSEFPQP